jgi:sulfite reductase (NADPH) hemoprotein beta-component
VTALRPRIGSYARERLPGERFGDFIIRAGVVGPTNAGNDFHAKLGPKLSAA